MNFLKYRASQLAKQLDPRRSTNAEVRRVESLAQSALEIRNRLVECNLRLVTSQARRFADSTGLPMDELISEGHVALLNAVDKFDYSRGNKFSTYATTAIHHQMVACLHRARRDGERVAYQQGEVLDAEPGEGRSVESEAYVSEISRLLGSMIGRLDERERYIVQSRFGVASSSDLKTIKTIAEDFGVTKQRVQQLQVRALNKLREMVSHVGISDADGCVA
jgi:RNA polymerase sigma factor (sigma-70 family)